MSFFPTSYYSIELKDNSKVAITNLKNNTDLTKLLVSTWTKKAFRGQVANDNFKIISSEIGRGSVCVFIGKLNENQGTICIRIHNAFKVMFLILLSYPLIGLVITAFSENLEAALRLSPILILAFLILRFVVIEFSFRIISKTGLSKLMRILGIKKIVKTRFRGELPRSQ